MLTLTKDRAILFEEALTLYQNMSARTMDRVMKEHLWPLPLQYNIPRCLSDYCQYCADYDDKVLPKARDMMDDCREQLQKPMPNYGQAWDEFMKGAVFKHNPVLEMGAFEHYVAHHHEKALRPLCFHVVFLSCARFPTEPTGGRFQSGS